MPELPEVETIRRGLEPVMVGAQFVSVTQRRGDLRVPFPERFAERLAGRRIYGLGRRAKYLIADLDDDEVLVMHLGMSGSFRVYYQSDDSIQGPFPHVRSEDGTHDHVLFELSNGARIVYNDPRRFGLMDLIGRRQFSSHPLFRDMGVEPLGNELNGVLLARIFAGRTSPLKAALLDQKLIAGLGNIYACEALHRARLSPRRAAGTLARPHGTASQRAETLARVIRDVLEEAVEAGGSSLRDHRRTDGSLGYFQHRFRVYDRENEPCPTAGCHGVIKRIMQSGRSTFYCGKCQK